MINNKTIYFDMDGVTAKWETIPADKTKERGYFLNLTPEPCIVALINALRALGANVCMLSAVWSDIAAEEKSIWLNKVFDENLNRIFVPYGANKADYISGGSGALLIDDYSPNLFKWAESGNLAIKFYNGINGKNGTWKGPSINIEQNLGMMLASISNVLMGGAA